MEKTINITLGGFMFILEEDAYKKLDDYLNSIKEHYRLSGEEKDIVNDIESGVAEKFSERTGAHKKVISLGDVEEIIGIMGTVREIAAEDNNSDKDAPVRSARSGQDEGGETGRTSEEPSRKRLYRNPDDTIMAGVCSGLAVYFGIDPVFIRILFIVFTFFNGIGILVYIIFWMIMPSAKTGSQKLEMRGRPVNLSEIQEAVKQKSKMIGEESREAFSRLKNTRFWYRALNFPIRIIERIFFFLKKLIGFIFPAVSVFLGVMFLLLTLAAILGLTIALGFMVLHIGSPFINSDVPLKNLASDPFYYLATVSVYFTVFVPLVFLSFLGITMIRRKNAFAPVASGVLAGIWMLAIIGGVVAAGDLVPQFNIWMKETAVRETETRSFANRDFSKLYLGGNLKVKVRSGNDFSIVLTGRKSDLDRLNFETEDGQLQITQKGRESGGLCLFCFDRDITGEIIVPRLESFVGINHSQADIKGFIDNVYISLGEAAAADIELQGQDITGKLSGVSSRLALSGATGLIDLKMDGGARLISDNIRADKINLVQTTWSRSELKGAAGELRSDLKNGGRMAAGELAATKAWVRASDYSRAELWAISFLEAAARDQAEIIYRGRPENFIKHIDGEGRIEGREDDFGFETEAEEAVAPRRLYIKPDVRRYSPTMSSIRGIGLQPKWPSEPTGNRYFIWRADQGYFVTDWDRPEMTREIRTESADDKVYWTYLFEEAEFINKAEPVHIFLEARAGDDEEAETAELNLEWTEDGVMVRTESEQTE